MYGPACSWHPCLLGFQALVTSSTMLWSLESCYAACKRKDTQFKEAGKDAAASLPSMIASYIYRIPCKVTHISPSLHLFIRSLTPSTNFPNMIYTPFVTLLGAVTFATVFGMLINILYMTSGVCSPKYLFTDSSSRTSDSRDCQARDRCCHWLLR